MKMFFRIKGFNILAMKLGVLTFIIKFCLLSTYSSQPSQVILTPCDNVENNNNNNSESNIEVPK